MNIMDTDIVYWDHNYDPVLLTHLFIVIGLFTALRLFAGKIAHINASHELLTKHNPAFGISLAGTIFALTLMLSGTLYSDPDYDILNSAVSVGVYGVVGIILMIITRMIFDKIALPHVSLRNEILRGNMAVAIADTGNVIAAALIIRAVMIWITDNSLEGLIGLLAGYTISQIILTLTTSLRLKLFSMRHHGRSTQNELKDGNIALALSFAGKKIGTAFAITIASELVVYELYDMMPILLAWVLVSIVMVLCIKILSYIAAKIILFRIDATYEILEQRNIAIGAVQAIIYISIAILLGKL